MRPARLLALVLVAYTLAELGAFAVHSLARGEPFSFARLAERRREARAGAEASEVRIDARRTEAGGWAPAASVALHPYLGYVRRAGSGGDHPVNEHGFLEKPFTGDRSRAVTVAFAGGSFAEQHFASLDAGAFDFLSELPRFRDRPVRLVSLAMRGYKQPQQLLAVSWFLALGERIDVLVNLDGFNEVALADEIRRYHGVHPAYPYHWAPLTRVHFTPEYLRAAGEIGLLRRLRAAAAGAAAPLRFSVTASALWDAVDRALVARIAAASARLERSGEVGDALPDFRRGPPGPDAEDFPRWSAALWERSSRQLAEIAESGGFAYFHFLQPNQYLPGSKRLSESEREVAVSVPRYAEAVRVGYPLLQQAGGRLAASGVAFHDLTPLFRDEDGTIYVDRCCHVGERGNALIAAEIARAVRDGLGGSGS